MQALSRGKAWVRGYSPASLIPMQALSREKPRYEAIVQLASFPWQALSRGKAWVRGYSPASLVPMQALSQGKAWVRGYNSPGSLITMQALGWKKSLGTRLQ